MRSNHRTLGVLGCDTQSDMSPTTPPPPRYAVQVLLPEAAVIESQALFRFLQDRFESMLDGLDILVTPAAPGEAPVGLAWTGDAAFNFIWTSLHVPCVTVPAGTGPNGMPLGVQIVAPRGRDREALAWAAWVAGALA